MVKGSARVQLKTEVEVIPFLARAHEVVCRREVEADDTVFDADING